MPVGAWEAALGRGKGPRRCPPAPRGAPQPAVLEPRGFPADPPWGCEEGKCFMELEKKKVASKPRPCQLLRPALRQPGQRWSPPSTPIPPVAPGMCHQDGGSSQPELAPPPAQRETEAEERPRGWQRGAGEHVLGRGSRASPPSIPCAPPQAAQVEPRALSPALAPDAGGFISLLTYF